MITAGCDVGSLTAKAVILKDGAIVASEVIRAKTKPEDSAREVMDLALKKAGLEMGAVEYCVGTGYGRKHIPFVNDVESEIACHGRGAVWQVPSAKTVVDIGGQDCKAIRVDESGNVTRYVYNDKCASGTGRFLEIIAEALDIGLEELGDISEHSTKKLTLSNQCVVFAETEIISLVNEGAEIPDIIRALHNAVASRAASLAKSIVVESDVVMSGGVAKNAGMFRALSEALGVPLRQIGDPQINGALGAALLAADKLKSGPPPPLRQAQCNARREA
ncbi:MAG: 2-hydroxyglutaryl-CoA dehydratase [Spirochaetes bacterium]|nr:2-hydroxyglutaryl-CoA dehydratase [Spirochaetota bacterium]